MMSELRQNQLLEIYKLHAHLVDQVSHRRDSANRLFASLATGMVIFIGAFLRWGSGDVPKVIVLLAIGVVGISLSVAWFVTIRSYKQLNRAKLKVLHDLETKLPYAFFTYEWDPEGHGIDVPVRKTIDYRALTSVESWLPGIFILLFLGVAIYGFTL